MGKKQKHTSCPEVSYDTLIKLRFRKTAYGIISDWSGEKSLFWMSVISNVLLSKDLLDPSIEQERKNCAYE